MVAGWAGGFAKLARAARPAAAMPATARRGELEQGTLVLGGSGFLGVHVARAAARQGPTVTASRHAPPREAGACGRHVVCDALREGEVEALLERLRPARAILCTALARGADCDARPDLARALNAELAGRVARAAAALGTRLVCVSTDLVFGQRAAPPGGFTESDSPGPVSCYGETKLEGERAALRAQPSCLVVRLPLLFGASFGRALGASDALCAQVARGERPRLFEDEWRTPLDVARAAQALVDLAWTCHAGLLHVCGTERMNRWELGLRALAAAGLDREQAVRSLQRARRADLGLDRTRPEDVSLDGTRARALEGLSIP